MILGAASGGWAKARNAARAHAFIETKFYFPLDALCAALGSLGREIDRLRERLVLQRVVKRHRLGARLREHLRQTCGEGVVGTLIGPEPEHPARAQLRSQKGEPRRAVEGGVARIEQGVGGM